MAMRYLGALYALLALALIGEKLQVRGLVQVFEDEMPNPVRRNLVDQVLSEAELEDKMNAYLIDGSRDLQDDPTQYCTSWMDVTIVDNATSYKVSTMYPLATGYPNNLRRCIIFVVPSNIYLKVALTFISTEPNFDFAEVYPITGYDTNTRLVSGVGSRLLQLSGMSLPDEEADRTVVGSLGQDLMLVLRTDGNRNTWSGFQASVESFYRDCNNGMKVIYTDRTPITFSDGYVLAYPANYAYCWVIIPPKGEYVQVTWSSMNTEKDIDLVEVSTITNFDAGQATYTGKRNPPYGIYSGLTIPPQLSAQTDEIVLINFRSDQTLQFPGFSGNVVSPGSHPTLIPTTRPTLGRCENSVQTFTAPDSQSGLVISDGFELYPINSVFCYMVTPSSLSTFALIIFDQIALHPAGNDFIEVYPVNVPLSTSPSDVTAGPPIRTFISGTSVPQAISGDRGQSFLIRLVTDSQGSAGGFRATIKSSLAVTPAPTVGKIPKECASSMVLLQALPLAQGELTINNGLSGPYPPDYMYCVVIRGIKGYRLSISFDQLDIANDRLDVFSVRTFNLAKRTYKGRTYIRRFGPQARRPTPAVITVESPLQIISKNSLPVIISLRPNGDSIGGQGFVARVSVVASPTSSPTAPAPCSTKMSILTAKEFVQRLEDSYAVLPQGINVCWVILPLNGLSFNSITFDTVSLHPGATLMVAAIQSYNQARKSYSGLERPMTVTQVNTNIQTRPGAIMLVQLSTDKTANSARATGFQSRFNAPCFCPMYQVQDSCVKASCGCEWYLAGCRFLEVAGAGR